MPNSASIISASRLVVVLLVLTDLQQQHQCHGNSDIDLSGFINAQAPEIHLQLQPSCAAKGVADADADGSHAAAEGSSSMAGILDVCIVRCYCCVAGCGCMSRVGAAGGAAQSTVCCNRRGQESVN